jgi:hypothetical protein
VRTVYLRTTFHKMRQVYAAPGTAAHADVRRELARLADERLPLPASEDWEELRSPLETIWARRVKGTELVLTYSVLPLMVEVRSIHPVW